MGKFCSNVDNVGLASNEVILMGLDIMNKTIINAKMLPRFDKTSSSASQWRVRPQMT